MSWVTLKSELDRWSKHCSLTRDTECKVIAFPKSLTWYKYAYASMYHQEDYTKAFEESLSYTTLGQCLDDKRMCQPEWWNFIVLPSGMYAIIRTSQQAIVIRLSEYIAPNSRDAEGLMCFRKSWKEDNKYVAKGITKMKRVVKDIRKRIRGL